MGSDDRIDTALRAIAQADASGGFSARVRERVAAAAAGSSEAGNARWWPRLATAAAGLMVVAAIWWPRETPVSPTAYVAPATAQPAAAEPDPWAPRVEPRDDSRHAPARVFERRVSGASAHVDAAIATASDHDLALEPLAALTALALPSIDPPAVIVADEVIVPLAPVAPLRVHEMPGNLEKGAL